MARWVAQRDANYNSHRKLGAILIGKLTWPATGVRWVVNFNTDHILQLTEQSTELYWEVRSDLCCPVLGSQIR